MAQITGLPELKFKVSPAPSFIRQLRNPLRKYPKMKSILQDYMNDLEKGIKGHNIPGHNEFWKDRIAMKPYGIGQSGGLRIISYHIVSRDLIVPALIYAKADLENPPHQMMIEAATEIREWLLSRQT